MSRVIAQGDFRPMADNKEAMADLERILAARTPLYAKADAIVETAGQTVEASMRNLLSTLPESSPPCGEQPQRAIFRGQF